MVTRILDAACTRFMTSLALFILLIARVTLGDPGPPSFKLTFCVYFNSSGIRDVTTECGTYYAETFLGSFFKSKDWLGDRCRNEGGVTGPLRIYIANRATVNLFGMQIQVAVTINLYSEGATRSDLLDCGSIINDTLQDQNSSTVPLSSAPFMNSITFLPDNENCTAAVMSPQKFYFHKSVWVCSDSSQVPSSDEWACVDKPDEGTPKTPVTSTTLRSDMPRTDITPETTQDGATVTTQTATPSVITPPIDWPLTSPSQNGTSQPGDVSNNSLYLLGHWGIELSDGPSKIRLVEGGPDVPLGVRFWANRTAVCHDASPTDCQVKFIVNIAGGDYSSPKCRRTGENIPQVVFGKPPGLNKLPYCNMPVPENVTDPGLMLLLRAVQDNKYDGTQRRPLAMSLVVTKGTEVFTETIHRLEVEIEDQDRKATCKSINDPHITTFDGLEYNNYYEGEFVLYRHKELPATVHVVYQRCSTSVQASCNCAVAIQSGDDVLVIDRCFRTRKHLDRISGVEQEINPMSVQLYLNSDLTPGTKIYQNADGKKYYIYLPHGTFIKVMISGMLINVWIVASPADLHSTEGLCGMYDKRTSTDLPLSNGTMFQDQQILDGSRGQPTPMLMNWRVDMETVDSLLQGVAAFRVPYMPPKYCQCEEDAKQPYCAYSAHVDNCDIIQGVDVTDLLVRNAVKLNTSSARRRKPRDIEDNTISVISRDPILINKDFVPPKYKWRDNSRWNEATAKSFCQQYIRDNYTLGRLCNEMVPSVNFQQEIATCMEDIQITDNTSWASSARDAMKEQCLEEIQKNGSLPGDVANRIQGRMCINDCSQHGICSNSVCHCEVGYSSADCSVPEYTPPYAGELPSYGLCDIRSMNCSTVIVYGNNFINRPSLTCFFQECQVTEESYIAKDVFHQSRAIFINFNAVECIVPKVRCYLISVSNNGINRSDPLLYVPFDPRCNTCNAFNTTCSKLKNSCIIDSMCYGAGESSPNDDCLVCQPVDDDLQWTTLDGMKCQPPWWKNIKLPNWAVAVPAAIGGSVVGVLVGFLLYKCCRKANKKRDSNQVDMTTHTSAEGSPFEDAILHRNRGLPVFSSDRFDGINLPQPPADYDENYFYNDGRGVENGVDSTTYF